MKRPIFTSTLFLAILFITLKVQALTITGSVKDARDKQPLPGVTVKVKNTTISSVTDAKGNYKINIRDNKGVLIFSFLGYKSGEIKVANRNTIHVLLQPDITSLNEVVVVGYGAQKRASILGSVSVISAEQYEPVLAGGSTLLKGKKWGKRYDQRFPKDLNTESYSPITENRFRKAKQEPLSTFGIDVDAASYTNIRRYINNGNLPPIDAVRIEEMINYFSYQYPQPERNEPFSVNTEISSAPWHHKHRLVKIGLQGKKIPTENLPSSNFVFLIDVSGSMNQDNKLPLVKSSIKLLVDQLRESDKVSIVVYAGAAGLVLPSTSGDKKQTIKSSLDALEAGGSTAGGQGIKLAYQIAIENFIKGGNNRVILATDGDFNVGASSDAEMQRLIEEKRDSGVFLTVLGYGMGNYKDSKMETLADKGNGNYAYIDEINEARKVLVNEFGGTLFTIAKDVKLQVEFNPEKVKSYRLIGYENRLLNKEDFNNDKKDAGDMGSGHTVTALYEIIPAGVDSRFDDSVDKLKYQTESDNALSHTDELFTIKLRYKQPDGNKSKLIEKAVKDKSTKWDDTSADFRFAAAVAGYGMLLRNSEFLQETDYQKVISWAKSGMGRDNEGYRNEFLDLLRSSALMTKSSVVSSTDN